MAIEFENKNKQIEGNKETAEVKEKNVSTASTIFLGLSIVSFLGMLCYSIFPFFVLLYFLLGLIYFIITVCLPVICTVGFIFLNDGFSEYSSNTFSYVTKLFDSETSAKIFDTLAAGYWFVAGIGGTLVLTGLIISIVAKIRDKTKSTDITAFLIVEIIISVLFTIAAIIGFSVIA